MHHSCPCLPYGIPKQTLVVSVVPPMDGYVHLRIVQTFVTVLKFENPVSIKLATALPAPVPTFELSGIGFITSERVSDSEKTLRLTEIEVFADADDQHARQFFLPFLVLIYRFPSICPRYSPLRKIHRSHDQFIRSKNQDAPRCPCVFLKTV